MRLHAKASSAGSTQRQASGLGGYFRGAFATRASSHGADGSGAPSPRGTGLPVFSLLAAFAVSLGLFASTASATISHNPEPFSPLTGAASGVAPYELSGIAIDEATGNTFVTNGEGNGLGPEVGVMILGGEGGVPVELTSPFLITGLRIEGNTPSGLAFDNSATSPGKGTLYAWDSNAKTINKYVRNAGTEKYELSGEISVPGGSYGGGLGLDAAGNVYLGSPAGSTSIYKFSPAGALLAEYDLSGVTPFGSAGQIAVDSVGDLFVQAAGGVYKFPADGSGEIDPENGSLFIPGGGGGVAYDSGTNHIYASVDGGVVEYDATTGDKISEFGAETFSGRIERVAVDSSTERIYVVDYKSSNVAVFGPPVIIPTVDVGIATDVTGTEATLHGSVDPEELAVEECFFEYGKTDSYGQTAPCAETVPTDSEPHAVTAALSGLSANGTVYHYRLVAKNVNGPSRSADKTFETANTVTTEPATGIGSKVATLNGIVRPGGLQYTSCVFEYGLTTSSDFERSVPCAPPVGSIEPDFSPHPVKASIGDLKASSAYKFRLTATNSTGTLSGEVLTFTTNGPAGPELSEIRALDADQNSATLEARINPSGFGTSYRFEWGPTSSYGTRIPAEFEPFIGSGTEPVRVAAKISGLTAGTTYHYRVVASNAGGIVASPDQEVETLNSCGLAIGRCFELVSPSEVGPVAAPGNIRGAADMRFQVATGPGGLVYTIENGLPDATAGAEVLYRGFRGPGGWNSAQFTPPNKAVNEGAGSLGTRTLAFSDDLSCAVVLSAQLLTDDASTHAVQDGGGENLYRSNPDGTYTAISKLPPENEVDVSGPRSQYDPVGMSKGCGKVVFSSPYRYPGVPGVGQRRLYEWDEGTLRNVGVVPGVSGETVVEAKTGGPNVVSEDGSRVFFTAERQAGADPLEVGVPAIFVREDGTTTRDVSQSQGALPSQGATYQYATKDGSRVFFTANAGLTAETSSEGTDLYEYNLETDVLTDLSVDPDANGAAVGGLIGASEDGSVVYFAAQGELDPGRGESFAENEAADTYSVYRASGSTVTYVGKVQSDDLERVVAGSKGEWTSRVSSDGRYLLFESSANVTAYQSDENKQAYLFDAEAPATLATVCVSCRQDGLPPVPRSYKEVQTPLSKGRGSNPLYNPQTLIVRGGQARVIFSSPDKLAPEAEEETTNIYEWAHGQVFLLTTEPSLAPREEFLVEFAGASADGTDVYFSTPEALTWEDRDERSSVYDARVGGGFPQPPAPPAPCNPDSEGSCRGASLPAPATPPPAGSTTFTGPGNAAAKGGKPKQKKHKKKKQKKQGQKHQKSGKKTSKRDANANRRAGK